MLNATSIDMLLDNLQSRDDLSNYTKKETAGYISIFTREDLDRMKVKSFGELIDKIPFLKNKLDNYGTNDPFYRPFQIASPSNIRLFINDREVVTPLFGSGIRIFGQTSIDYIDHIEIYHSIPSYEIAIEPSVVVIKAYTKTPERENSKVIGASIGSRNSLDSYFYSAEELEDFSYFSYVNYANLNNQKQYNQGSELSRDKDFFQLFTQFSQENSKIDIHLLNSKLDNFAGLSFDMTPDNNNIDFTYFSPSYTYDSTDKSLKFILNYTYFESKLQDSSSSPLGFRKIATAPFYIPYYTINTKIKEHQLDLKLTKKIKFDETSILLGFSNRFKKFDFSKYNLGGVDYTNIMEYNSENITSLFAELTHDIDSYNSAIFSINTQYYKEEANIKSRFINGGRVGHIYKKDNFMQKTFLSYGQFFPTSTVLLMNDLDYGALRSIKPSIAYGLSTKAVWKMNDLKYSILLGRTISDKSIYRDLSGFHNQNFKSIFDTISLDASYRFQNSDRLDFGSWAVAADYSEKTIDRYSNDFGGYITLYNRFGGVDIYNSIAYAYGEKSVPDGWNLNSTITYNYSRSLNFYLKGINLLDKALKSDYVSYNPLTNSFTFLDDIPNIDRSFWIGLEYQF